MRTLIAMTAFAAMLAGCQNSGDPKICTMIIDPPPPPSLDRQMTSQEEVNWNRTRAEACLHRQAYRLANSSDPAETVAHAVTEACEAPIAESAAWIHKVTWDGATSDEQAALSEQARLAAIESYGSFALLKVVEGRAGKCKPD